MPRDVPPAVPEPAVLEAEDAPQGELVLAAPAILAGQVLGEDGDLPMPPQEASALSPDPALGEAAALAEAPEAAAGPRPRNRPANFVAARPRKAAPAREPAEAKVEAPKPAAEVASAAPAAGVRPGARLVQLGAFDSEEITRQAWSQLVAKNPDLLSSKNLYVERTTANARVFYRLRVAGFESSDETRRMCEALRARGVACIPVTLQ
jgi:hypothetical protein